jgi:hypothetical protein
MIAKHIDPQQRADHYIHWLGSPVDCLNVDTWIDEARTLLQTASQQLLNSFSTLTRPRCRHRHPEWSTGGSQTRRHYRSISHLREKAGKATRGAVPGVVREKHK